MMTPVRIQHRILTNEYWFVCRLNTRAVSSVAVYLAISVSWLRGHDPLHGGDHSFEVLDSICHQLKVISKWGHSSCKRNMSCTERIPFGD